MPTAPNVARRRGANRRRARELGLPVDVAQRNPDRLVPGVQRRGERRRAGDGVAHPIEAGLPAQQPPVEPGPESAPGAPGDPASEQGRRRRVDGRQQPAAGGGRAGARDRLGPERLQQQRRREEDGRPARPQILGQRLRAAAVEGVTGERERRVQRQEPFRDVGGRQERDEARKPVRGLALDRPHRVQQGGLADLDHPGRAGRPGALQVEQRRLGRSGRRSAEPGPDGARVERLHVGGQGGVRGAADPGQPDRRVQLDDAGGEAARAGPRALRAPDDQHPGAGRLERPPELVVGGADVERLQGPAGEADRQLEDRIARVGVGQYRDGSRRADRQVELPGEVDDQPAEFVPGQGPPAPVREPVADRRALRVPPDDVGQHRAQAHAGTTAGVAASRPSAPAEASTTRRGLSSR